MHCSPLIGPPSAHWTTRTAAFRPPGRVAVPGRKHAASRRGIRRAATLPGGRYARILNRLGLPTIFTLWEAAGVAVHFFFFLLRPCQGVPKVGAGGRRSGTVVPSPFSDIVGSERKR